MSTDNPNPKRAPEYLTFPEVRERFKVFGKTPGNWVSKRYVTVYRDNDGTLLLDANEIEAALKLYGPSKMRDGRRRFGADIRPLPIEAVSE